MDKQQAPPIIFDGEKLCDLYCGLGQYCYHLYTELRGLDGGISLYTYPHVTLSPALKDQIVPVKRWHRKLPTLLRKLFHSQFPKSKIWHVTHQDSEFFDCVESDYKILTIHDLNFMSELDYIACQKKMDHLQSIIDRCAAIVYISHFTKDEVHKHFTIPTTIIEQVIYNGVSFGTEIESPPEFVVNTKFFFTIGTVVRKKNFHVLLKVMHSFPDYHLFIAGPADNEYGDLIREMITSEQLNDRVILLGRIDESQKRWFYAHCEALLFPSLLEGFGIPVIEAMSYGKPLFLSNRTSLPEIGGEDAFYFPCFDPEEMVKTIREGLDCFTVEQAERLRQRVNKYSWKNAAQEYFQLYSQFRHK